MADCNSAGITATPSHGQLEPCDGMVECKGPSGPHCIHYMEWGESTSPRVMICVHGLSRNSRDFDFVAAALAVKGFRVICVDLPGRGKSAWLRGGAKEYSKLQYLSDIETLLARIKVKEVDWLGTSLGGILGILWCARGCYPPIRSLILNDLGTRVPKSAVQGIREYLCNSPRTFPDLQTAASWYRDTFAGDLSLLPGQTWMHLATHGTRQLDDGSRALHYDPAIVEHFCSGPAVDIDYRNAWKSVHCSTLVLRGALSDLLTPETTDSMSVENPHVKVVEIPGFAHAPPLATDFEIRVISEWLADT